MSQNTVKVIDNYIDVCFIGDQSYDAVKDVGRQAQAAAQEFINQDEWVRVLIDLSREGKITAGSRRATREVYSYGTYDRLAIFGFNKLLETFINGLIKASRRESHVRLFDNREDALEWLLKDQSDLKI